MAESLVAGAVVTLIIEAVISYAKSALICKRVCRKLEEELRLIQPDVRKIEQQMVRLRRRVLPTGESLEVVESWLARLKEKLTEAEREVHRCSSGSQASRFHFKENHDLTKKIQGLLTDIHKLAGDDVSRVTLSSTISIESSHSGCCSSQDTSQHGSSHHSHGSGVSHSLDGPILGFASQGSRLHRKRMDEIDSILRAEEQTRQSMNRRHTTGSFDFSKPTDQPVAHEHVEAPLGLHLQQQEEERQQQQYNNVHHFPQPEHYYAPQGFHSSSYGHNVYHG